MSLSLNTANAASFRSYVEMFVDDLLVDKYVGFKTANVFNRLEGVKGKAIITHLEIEDLATRYSNVFTPGSNLFNFTPRAIEVFKNKVDSAIVPQDFELSYIGKNRKKGQDSYDLPFEGQILAQKLKKLASEQEFAIWRAANAAVPASTDKLIATFDGVRKVIKDEINATNVTPIATGALTNTNTVAAVESCYEAIGDQYKDGMVDIFMNPTDKIKLIQDYRERYGKYYEAADGTVSLEVGTGVFHFLSGVPVNCILVTPKENCFYAYDGPMDASMINFEDEDRKIKMWMDFYMGFNFGIVNDDIIAVNNQWTV